MSATTTTKRIFARTLTGNEPVNNPLLQSFAIAKGYQTTLSATATPNTYQIPVADNTPFLAGDKIIAFAGSGEFSSYKVTGKTGSTILLLDRPVDYPSPAGTPVVALSDNMNVDGSVTPKIFSIRAGSTRGMQFTRILFAIGCTNEPDYAKFGDLPALTNGITFRIAHNDGTYKNLGNIKSNGELGAVAYDTTLYLVSKNFNTNGVSSRLTFTNFSGVIELDKNEELQAIVRDNLSTLLSVRITPEGKQL